MKPFDDLLPEEKEPQHEELITLLQGAYRRPVFVPPAEQEQIINRVRERLIETDLRDSLNEDRPVSQIGVLDSFPHKPVSPAGMPRRDLPRFRLITLLAAALVIAVLLGTPLLLLRPRLPSTGGQHQIGAPALTLSSSVAKVGDTVTLTIAHFSDSASVALTHDIQEPIKINGNSSFIATDSKGMAKVSLAINNDWGPGFHPIVAEDVATRYIARAYLQITGEWPTPPPHLLIDTTHINLGADVVGANTIHPFNLENKGGGSISWSASSNRSWLLISPGQGIFSQSQTISLAVQRAGLKPGDYTGSITISSNVSETEHVEVDMTVQALPANAGAVLALPPALLSFTAIDGGPNPATQSLAISNPGSRPLNWSLAVNAPTTSIPQVSPTQVQGLTCNWLSATPNRGTVAPGATSSINVRVQSKCLLPGVYTDTLKFTAAGGAYDGPQSVNVSVTVQPHCGIVTSSGSMPFNTVAGEGNLGNQTLTLSATASCAGSTLSWSATSSASWLTVTPSSGQLKGTAGVVVSVSVNVGNLPVGQNQGMISFIAGQSTQTVIVQLNVQPTPSPAAPLMGASPLSINFSNIQGQPNPAGQVVTITNNGGSSLKWSSAINQSASNWLGTSPSSGSILPGQTGQVTINVNTSSLTPGNYEGQVILNGKDARANNAPGSPQTITISLVIQPPCSISLPSSSALSFSAVLGASSNLTPQTVTFTGMGNCAWPVTWNAITAPAASWLTLTPAKGAVAGAGQSGSVGVAANIVGLQAGTYTTEVTISSSDVTGEAVQGNSQTFAVTLTVLPPCVLSPPAPASLAFSANQGQSSSAARSVVLSETGTCGRPVTWTATGDANSSSWLVLSTTSGSDSGSGSTLGGVNVNATGLTPGNYIGTITIAATDSSGATVSGSGQTISVSLKVTATLSGSVVACPGSTPPTCTAPQPLPGAMITLMRGNITVAMTKADASGNYSFSGLGSGTYTISAAGFDASNNHFIGTTSLPLTGNMSNVMIQAFPG
jgi:hypothetical protein